MRALPLLASLALSGCNPFSYDPAMYLPADMAGLDRCTMAPSGRSCVTLHLRGAVDPIDTVQVDAIFELGGDYVARRIVSRNPGGAVKPPIAVGVILTQNAGDSVELKVLATNGATPVAIGSSYVSGLRPGEHDAASINLIPAAQSRCFDGVKDGDEVDADCGWIGECPVCTLGNRCISARDCADSACANAGPGSVDYRCR
jgi:hypothetical protein